MSKIMIKSKIKNEVVLTLALILTLPFIYRFA